MIGQQRIYRFMTVDVFTERIFGGNPLAVFADARGLSTQEMQSIANEMNLSETTFIFSPSRPEYSAQVRIFTPIQELPFAGHPTIGTAFVLATQGYGGEGSRNLVLEEGVGPVQVRFEGEASSPRFLWMKHPQVMFGPALDNRDATAEAIGLNSTDLIEDAPILVGSTGVPFLYIPVRTRESVDRAVHKNPALLAASSNVPLTGIFIFAPESRGESAKVYSRMLALESLDLREDPATGSASGPLGVYLVRQKLVSPADDVHIVSEQGTKMGRQSFIHIHIVNGMGASPVIEVGGSVVPVYEGELHLPRPSSLA